MDVNAYDRDFLDQRSAAMAELGDMSHVGIRGRLAASIVHEAARPTVMRSLLKCRGRQW
jgi:hypothetical protein